MLEFFAVSVMVFLMALMVMVFLGIILQTIYDNSAVSIFTDRSKDGLGWHRVQVDWFYLRGLCSVIQCYVRWIFTLGRFKFDWEVQ